MLPLQLMVEVASPRYLAEGVVRTILGIRPRMNEVATGEVMGLLQENVGVVAVVRTTATGEGGWDDREGLTRPLTTSAKVVRGVADGGIGQHLSGVGGVLCGGLP